MAQHKQCLNDLQQRKFNLKKSFITNYYTMKSLKVTDEQCLKNGT